MKYIYPLLKRKRLKKVNAAPIIVPNRKVAASLEIFSLQDSHATGPIMIPERIIVQTSADIIVQRVVLDFVLMFS